MDPGAYFRGTGSAPFIYCAIEGAEDKFGGAAFVVETAEDLEYAANTLPSATPVYNLVDEPGGGACVTFTDPVDGFPFHLVYGQTVAEGNESSPPQLKFNFVSSSALVARSANVDCGLIASSLR